MRTWGTTWLPGRPYEQKRLFCEIAAIKMPYILHQLLLHAVVVKYSHGSSIILLTIYTPAGLRYEAVINFFNKALMALDSWLENGLCDA